MVRYAMHPFMPAVCAMLAAVAPSWTCDLDLRAVNESNTVLLISFIFKYNIREDGCSLEHKIRSERSNRF